MSPKESVVKRKSVVRNWEATGRAGKDSCGCLRQEVLSIKGNWQERPGAITARLNGHGTI